MRDLGHIKKDVLMSLALVFPGQGAQVVGMGMELAERFPVARKVLDDADDILDMSLSDIIANGPMEELTRTDISQPAILVMSWMAHEVVLWWCRNLNSQPLVVELGEYTALLAADALDFADALQLVRLRGQAMQDAADLQPSGMVALIGADEGAAKLCAAVAEGDVLEVANLNAPGQVVISAAAPPASAPLPPPAITASAAPCPCPLPALFTRPDGPMLIASKRPSLR